MDYNCVIKSAESQQLLYAICQVKTKAGKVHHIARKFLSLKGQKVSFFAGQLLIIV